MASVFGAAGTAWSVEGGGVRMEETVRGAPLSLPAREGREGMHKGKRERCQFCFGALSTIWPIATSLNLGSVCGVDERGGGCVGGGGSGVDERDGSGVCDGVCDGVCVG